MNLVAVIEAGWRGDRTIIPGTASLTDRRSIAHSRLVADARGSIGAAANWRAWPLYRPPADRPLLGRARSRCSATPPIPWSRFSPRAPRRRSRTPTRSAAASSQTEDIPEALAAYSRDRVARATRVQDEALRQGRIYHMSGPLAFARDLAMRFSGANASRPLRLALRA